MGKTEVDKEELGTQEVVEAETLVEALEEVMGVMERMDQIIQGVRAPDRTSLVSPSPPGTSHLALAERLIVVEEVAEVADSW